MSDYDDKKLAAQIAALRESADNPIDDEVVAVMSRHMPLSWGQVATSLKNKKTITIEEYARAMDRLVASGRVVVASSSRVVRYVLVDPNTLPSLF